MKRGFTEMPCNFVKSNHILEVKLPYDSVCPSVGRYVCHSCGHNFIKGRAVSFPCSYWGTCFFFISFFLINTLTESIAINSAKNLLFRFLLI